MVLSRHRPAVRRQRGQTSAKPLESRHVASPSQGMAHRAGMRQAIRYHSDPRSTTIRAKRQTKWVQAGPKPSGSFRAVMNRWTSKPSMPPKLPEFIVPTHCTRWKATHASACEFANAFVPNSIGTGISSF